MNKDFVILPDATCDLTRELRERFKIGFVPAHFTTADGAEHLASLEWDFSSRSGFYASLRKNPSAFKTNPPNVAEFAAVFEPFVSSGKGIICPVISSRMSGTYGNAMRARQEILEKYPGARITVIDSLRYSAAVGLMCIHASVMRDAGASYEEVAEALERDKLCYHQIGYLDDLSFTARTGRINNAAAFFGTLIGIKPMGDIDTNGMTTVIGKAKGEKKAFSAAIGYVKRTIRDAESQIVVISYSDREESALQFKTLVEKEICPKEVLLTNVFPSCGVSIGPGLMCIYYKGSPVSNGLEAEKKIIGELLGK